MNHKSSEFPLFSGCKPLEWCLSGDEGRIIVNGRESYYVAFRRVESDRDTCYGRFMALNLRAPEFSGHTREDVMKFAFWWIRGYLDAGGILPHVR